ncbi:MAG: DUF58 domain-containing protein [Desulforegulaceae bacterium]|nr:DUF58 domain-containing protein [Desulforegulaceae bacterium]
MISKEELKKIKKLHLKTSLMVSAAMSGQYRSVFRGSGMEFEEVREYKPGDDVRAIDWKVSARMNRPYIKVFREEREACVIIMIDMSSSGIFTSSFMTKTEKAAEFAAVAAYAAIKNNDRAGLILFTDDVELYLPPKKGVSHVWRLIKEIYTFERKKGLKTDISKALNFFSKVSGSKTICFLVSDFISDDFYHELKMAKKDNQIIGVKISDKNDFSFPEKGLVSFLDPETDQKVFFDLSSKKEKNLLIKKGLEFENNLKKKFQKINSDLLILDTDQSSADFLINYFRFRHMRVQKTHG